LSLPGLAARVRQFLGHIEDMSDDERVFLLGAFEGAVARQQHDLDSDEAQAAVGRSVAALEEDCSQAWPGCVRGGLVCDCRLRAVRAVNALKMHLSPSAGK
jgi:hypothetical protein